jgi:hypothetical protein
LETLESCNEELGDDFTFSSVSSETHEHFPSKEERENKSE